jgi:toxin ParE1/3/4
MRTVTRITKRSKQIGMFPLSGRQAPEYDADQIRDVFFGPYRIIYHITADQIDVIAVFHGAMNVLHYEQE